MDIAIHLGAHCTDEDLILKTLASNRAVLSEHGVSLPPPNVARPAMRKALQAGSSNLVPGMGNPLIAELLDVPDARRMIFSYEGFLATYATALARDRMYAEAGQRCAMLRDLFPGHSVQFFMAIRNPATFVPALFEASSVTDFAAFLSGHDLAMMAWSHPIRAIREACPEVPLTIWCNEDLPLIWPDVLESVAGIEASMSGEMAVLEQIMTKDGVARLRDYLKDNPVPNRATWRKVITAFLGKYADALKVEPEISQPGWTEEMIAGLSSLYEVDVRRIRAMDDVDFLNA